VWPFYYPDPKDPTDLDRYPVELASDKTKYLRTHRDEESKTKEIKKSDITRKQKEKKKSKKKKKLKKSKSKKPGFLVSLLKRLRFSK